MATSTVEQYIKTIYHEAERSDGEILPMKSLSDAMAVTPGTATSMVKHLAERNLVQYVPRKGVALTAHGRALALTMIRRHRLIETFLEQVLGYDWAEVHEDAEQLEHAVSDRFIQRLDSYLGHPRQDPHGAPIPSCEGVITSLESYALDTGTIGSLVRISRVDASDARFLELLKDHHVVPGEDFLLVDRNESAGTVTVRHSASRRVLVISLDQSSRVHVVDTAG